MITAAAHAQCTSEINCRWSTIDNYDINREVASGLVSWLVHCSVYDYMGSLTKPLRWFVIWRQWRRGSYVVSSNWLIPVYLGWKLATLCINQQRGHWTRVIECWRKNVYATEFLATPAAIFQTSSWWRADSGISRITWKLTHCVVTFYFYAFATLPEAIGRDGYSRTRDSCEQMEIT